MATVLKGSLCARTAFHPQGKAGHPHLFLGGVSHVDTFDYKPDLERHHGKPLLGKGTLDTFFGKPGNLMKSLYPFRQRGGSGIWVSDLLPHLANCVDDMTFIHSMVSKSSSHTPATFQMNTGFTLNGFPCMGAWLSYGLDRSISSYRRCRTARPARPTGRWIE